MQQLDYYKAFPQYRNLVLKLAWEIAEAHSLNYDEALSTAYDLYVTACEKYNPKRDVSIASWISYYVRRKSSRAVIGKTMQQASTPVPTQEMEFLDSPELESEFVCPMRGSELLDGLGDEARSIASAWLDCPAEILELYRSFSGSRRTRYTAAAQALRKFLMLAGMSADDFKNGQRELQNKLTQNKNMEERMIDLLGCSPVTAASYAK